MRITLQHFAVFLVLCAWGWVTMFWAEHETCDSSGLACGHLFLSFIPMAFGAVAITCIIGRFVILYGDDIAVTIPNPLATYRATLKEKRALNDAITRKYTAMYDAEGPRLDELQRQAQMLEQRLNAL